MKEYPKGEWEISADYFDVLSISAQSSSPESTRLAALQSLQSFSPVLTDALQAPTPSGQLLRAFIILFHFLSDDDDDIRTLASEITSSVLGEYMVFTSMTASEMLAQTIADAFAPEIVWEKYPRNHLSNKSTREITIYFRNTLCKRT